MRLIDADALYLELSKKATHWVELGTKTAISWATALQDAKRFVEDAPTMDPESLRKKGEWRFCKDEGHMLAECHLCGYVAEGFQAALWDFCPNCGADMRGDDDEAD